MPFLNGMPPRARASATASAWASVRYSTAMSEKDSWSSAPADRPLSIEKKLWPPSSASISATTNSASPVAGGGVDRDAVLHRPHDLGRRLRRAPMKREAA